MLVLKLKADRFVYAEGSLTLTRAKGRLTIDVVLTTRVAWIAHLNVLFSMHNIVLNFCARHKLVWH